MTDSHETHFVTVIIKTSHSYSITDRLICLVITTDHCTPTHIQMCCFVLILKMLCSSAEPIVRNGRPPSAHSVHSFLHQYTGSFKKPPLRRPQSVIGGGLGSLMVMPRNGSRLGETHTHTHTQAEITLEILRRRRCSVALFRRCYSEFILLQIYIQFGSDAVKLVVK